MKYVFVGLRDGQKSLNIPFILLITVVLCVFLGATTIAVGWYVRGELQLGYGLYGIYFGLGIVVWGILGGMMSRKKKLPRLDQE